MRWLAESNRERGRRAEWPVRIVGEIDRNLADAACRDMIDARPGDTVSVIVDSVGGDCASATRIATKIDNLRSSGVRINATVRGKCFSAAIDIVLACGLRRCRADARLMIHRRYLQLQDKPVRAEDLRRLAADLDRDDARDNARMAGLKLSAAELSAYRAGRDIYLDAGDALRIGLIHEILPVPAPPATRRIHLPVDRAMAQLRAAQAIKSFDPAERPGLGQRASDVLARAPAGARSVYQRAFLHGVSR